MRRLEVAGKWENPVTNRGGRRCVRLPYLGASGGASP